MKLLRFTLYFILVILVFIVSFVLISGRTYLFKAAWYYTADIDDYKIFPNRVVASGQPDPWRRSAGYNTLKYPDSLAKKLDELKTVALVVIRKDSLLHEQYWQGYSDSSYSGSFSIAKSIVSLMIGVALKEGKISSLDQPVGDFLPEFREGEKRKVLIRHLLTMSSGSDWDESYSDPMSVTTEAYYGNNVYEPAINVKIVREPGSYHNYKSGDTELLGLVLEKATGKRISEYASEKIWKPIGAINPALWSLDKKDGREKAYCCFNSNASDFARLGQLMLDSGRWNGKEIIPLDFWRASVSPCSIDDDLNGKCSYYGYQWWILPDDQEVFYARGILGQFIVAIPSRQIVIVRLGEISGGSRNGNAAELVYWLTAWGKTL